MTDKPVSCTRYQQGCERKLLGHQLNVTIDSTGKNVLSVSILQ